MRATDLLLLLDHLFGRTSFNSRTVSWMLKEFSRKNPIYFLVDNPKGLETKWISNDLNRLRLMSFLHRKREKRAVSGRTGNFNRGFKYRYTISERGFSYLARMRYLNIGLTLKTPYHIEPEIFRINDNPFLSDVEKAASRQLLRINLRLTSPITNPEFYRMPNWQKQMYLADIDRKYRKAVGFNRRYRIFGQMAFLRSEVSEMAADIAWLVQMLRDS